MAEKEFEELKNLSPELRNILADDNANGVPDIADNPLTALGKLGDLMAVSGKMNPMLQKYIQSRMAKYNISVNGVNVASSESNSGSPDSSPAMPASGADVLSQTPGSANAGLRSLSTQPKIMSQKSTANMDAYLNASGIKTVQSGAGRNFLFIVGVLCILGWLVWQYGSPEIREAVIGFFKSLD